jgi:hypothetical protein
VIHEQTRQTNNYLMPWVFIAVLEELSWRSSRFFRGG